MPLSEIDDFLAALRRTETGSFAGIYGARDTRTGALGAYQIHPQNWVTWAAEAGVPAADWRDPAAQDRVARRKSEKLYRRYESWDLVAVYWFAGQSVADYASEHGGASAVAALPDIRGVTVGDYVDFVTSEMRTEQAQRYRTPGLIEPGGGLELIDGELAPEPPPPQPLDDLNRARQPAPQAAPQGRDLDAEVRAWIEQMEAVDESREQPVSPLRDKLVSALDTISTAIAGGERTLGGISEREAEVPELPSVYQGGQA